MQKVLTVVFALLAVAVLAGCGGQATPPPSASGTVSGKPVKVDEGTYTDVTPAELKQMLANKDFHFVNVHIPYEGELAQTDAFVPYNEVEQNLSKLPADKNAKIVLYCRSGHMSGIAAKTLLKLGYTNLWNLAGGMVAWEAAGLPVDHK